MVNFKHICINSSFAFLSFLLACKSLYKLFPETAWNIEGKERKFNTSRLEIDGYYPALYLQNLI